MPDGEFLTAREAWDRISSNQSGSRRFGHGDVGGAWFVWVNLARDYFSLAGLESSPWDGWRAAIGRRSDLIALEHTACQDLADRIEDVEKNGREGNPFEPPRPFWL